MRKKNSKGHVGAPSSPLPNSSWAQTLALGVPSAYGTCTRAAGVCTQAAGVCTHKPGTKRPKARMVFLQKVEVKCVR